jgi:hypothetical protein
LSWDEGEKIGHIMDSYQITFSVRLEFWSTGFYYIFSDRLFDIGLPLTEREISTDKIIPVFTDILAKEDLNLQPGWHLYNRASCRLDELKDHVDISEMFNVSIKAAIKYHEENYSLNFSSTMYYLCKRTNSIFSYYSQSESKKCRRYHIICYRCDPFWERGNSTRL